MMHRGSLSAQQVVENGVDEVLDSWAWWVGEDDERMEQMRTALRKYSIDLLDMFDTYMEDE
ncbi:hypothetical protein [Stenotrophomonas virus Jojan60]|nr:hypothetical protein [Stenotrophomonas virus Jojan60]